MESNIKYISIQNFNTFIHVYSYVIIIVKMYIFQMDDSGIDSDTTKRHTITIEENDKVIIYVCLVYYICILNDFFNILFKFL